MTRLVQVSEATAARRRVYFQLVDATDFATPETGEAGGQPQISTNGGSWTNTGIGTLTHIGNGRYYADLTAGAVGTAGDWIETRYKSANTAECPGDSVQVVNYAPDDIPVSVGSLAIDGSTLQKVLRGLGAVLLTSDVSADADTRTYRALDDSKVRVVAEKNADDKRRITTLDLD